MLHHGRTRGKGSGKARFIVNRYSGLAKRFCCYYRNSPAKNASGAEKNPKKKGSDLGRKTFISFEVQ
jgi:hypothetical protein